MHRLKYLWRRRSAERILADETRAHVEEMVEDLVSSGLSLEEAQMAAQRQFGNRTAVLENSRDEWALPFFEHLLQDLRYAARSLARSPLFAAAVVLPLALGIGANTAIFTVVNAALIRALPYRNPDRLVHLWEARRQSDAGKSEASYPDYLDWSSATRFFDGVAGYQAAGVMLKDRNRTDRIFGARVTPGFFPVLGTQAALGRTFLPGEDQPGHARVAVVSDGLWRRLFNADPAAVGKTVILSDQPFTIVGVLPPRFQFALVGEPEVWLPLVPSRQQRERRYWHWVNVIARLKAGATEQQGRAELAAIAASIAAADPGHHTGAGIRLAPLRDEIVGEVRPVLLVLMGAIGLVLLLACANVANLILVRSAARYKEIAVRGSLGASRGRIVQQLLTESLLLGLMGGTLGLLLAQWGVHLAVAAIPAAMRTAMPYLLDLRLNWGMLLFTAGLSVLTGVACGLAPALRLSRFDLHESLKPGRGTSAGAGHQRMRRLLLVVEVSISVVLLTGAGLMMKSTLRLLETNPGFNTSHLVTMAISLPARYSADPQVSAFHEEMIRRIEVLPGVSGASSVSVLPLAGGGNNGNLRVLDRPEPPGAATPVVNVRTIGAGYFHTMGIPLLEGRALTDRDSAAAPRVVMVNQRLAREVFPNESPVGRLIGFEWSPGPWQIVGVVADENTVSLDVEPPRVVYFPFLQDPGNFFQLVVRSTAPLETTMEAVRESVRSLDPDVPIFAVRTMEQLIADSPATFIRRYPAFLIGIFAANALLLATIGTYGLVAYTVTQRTQEIGIRTALGARPGDILRLIVGQGLALVLVGIAVGIAAASILARQLASLLFGVKPSDPPTFAIACGVLAAAALLACYIPARRAMRVAPARALE